MLETSKGINVLSLFDGMSCGQIALEKLGIKVDNYFASEIKKHAIKVTQDNYPSTIQLGGVEFVTKEMLVNYNIDLLIGGSPCQDLTIINQKQKGLKGDKSVLFYEYLRVLRSVKPKYFLLENVASMKTVDRDIITKELGVEPIMINSSLLSAQHRRRYYWTNIPNVKQPIDKNILLKDIIDYSDEREEKMSNKKINFINRKRDGTMYVRVDGEKSMPITARGYAAWNTQFITLPNNQIRDLTLLEYKKLQTIPVDYKMDIIKSKATDLIGDGWTVDVIAHIFKNLKTDADVK
jgi:site-specific DNA-cytosine methylase